MKEFIDKNNLLYFLQYGFCKLYFIEYVVFDIVEDILCNMDKWYFLCGVFIDLKKVFDMVNYEILFDKLNFYGFCGLINDWF